MPRLRYLALPVLLALLAWLQWQLWSGRGSYPSVERMREEIRVQRESNELARQDNERLANDITDLRDGREKMEEMARQEMGMIKPNEVFVQYTKP